MAGDRALFSVIGVLFIRSGTADGEAIGDNLSNSVRGSHGRVKARPGVSVSQGLLHPGSLLRLTDLTSFAAAQPPVHAPDERLSRVSNEQYKRRKSGFLCHTSSLLSVVGWVKGGTRSWQSQPRRNHWQTWVDSLPSPWVNTSNENYVSSALNPLLFFSRRSGCSSVFDWLENPCNLLLYLVRGQDWDEWWQMPAIDHLENYAAWHVETPGLTSQHYTITQVTLQGIIRQ